MAEERIDYSQWLKRGTSTFIPTDNAKTVSRVEPGVYNLRISNSIGFYLFKKELHLDELIVLPSEAEQQVLESITKFWDRKDKFKEYGFIYKRGILLYGPPGTGKTSLINIITDRMIKEHEGVVFVIQTPGDLDLYSQFIPEVFRTIEPGRPILTVIEDIDCFCTGGSTETSLINVLDGIEQMDNVIYLATTNYTEKLPQRIINRPNRFDRRIKIGYPSAEVRKAYLLKKLKPADVELIDKSPYPINSWVAETENMTLSHIGELIKSVVILDNPFEETIQILRELKEIPVSSQYNKGETEEGIGFKRRRGRRSWDDEGKEEVAISLD
jgi:SpoVK/Ycf46/Vps4 family AAA+-type ATPase